MNVEEIRKKLQVFPPEASWLQEVEFLLGEIDRLKQNNKNNFNNWQACLKKVYAVEATLNQIPNGHSGLDVKNAVKDALNV